MIKAFLRGRDDKTEIFRRFCRIKSNIQFGPRFLRLRRGYIESTASWAVRPEIYFGQISGGRISAGAKLRDLNWTLQRTRYGFGRGYGFAQARADQLPSGHP